jgi:hypothetical protein
MLNVCLRRRPGQELSPSPFSALEIPRRGVHALTGHLQRGVRRVASPLPVSANAGWQPDIASSRCRPSHQWRRRAALLAGGLSARIDVERPRPAATVGTPQLAGAPRPLARPQHDAIVDGQANIRRSPPTVLRTGSATNSPGAAAAFVGPSRPIQRGGLGRDKPVISGAPPWSRTNARRKGLCGCPGRTQ